jgi:hypothetical protein
VVVGAFFCKQFVFHFLTHFLSLFFYRYNFSIDMYFFLMNLVADVLHI